MRTTASGSNAAPDCLASRAQGLKTGFTQLCMRRASCRVLACRSLSSEWLRRRLRGHCVCGRRWWLGNLCTCSARAQFRNCGTGTHLSAPGGFSEAEPCAGRKHSWTTVTAAPETRRRSQGSSEDWPITPRAQRPPPKSQLSRRSLRSRNSVWDGCA